MYVIHMYLYICICVCSQEAPRVQKGICNACQCPVYDNEERRRNLNGVYEHFSAATQTNYCLPANQVMRVCMCAHTYVCVYVYRCEEIYTYI